MKIVVTQLANARRFRGVLKNDGTLKITVPKGADPDTVREMIDKIVADVKAHAPQWQPRYAEGTIIAVGDSRLIINHNPTIKPYNVVARRAGNDYHINVATNLPFGEQQTDLTINKVVLKCAKALAPGILLPRAAKIAEDLGVETRQWKIGIGHRVLGTCHPDRSITLSAINVFLPAELIDYIVCHELAHLSEMNHSPRFHQLLDSYLLGREKEFYSRLKSFNWPIIR